MKQHLAAVTRVVRDCDEGLAFYVGTPAAGFPFLEAPRIEPCGTVAVFQDLYGNRWDLLRLAREQA